MAPPQHVSTRTVVLDNKPVTVKRIVYTQAKNEHRKPVNMDIPVHPEVERIIDATPPGI